MKLIKTKTKSDLAKAAAKIVAGQVAVKPGCVIGLATGSTPEGMYAELIRMHRDEGLDFSDVKSFNLDEYFPIKAENPQSYRYYMDSKLFNHINIKPENTHVPSGEDAAAADAYDDLIESAGGVDLQVLGIGRNGHIGFNEPAAILESRTHLTDLTPDTILANSRNFSSIGEVPKKAVTMGMATILRAKKIIILISGTDKKAALAKLLEGKIDTSCPATLLNLHGDVTVIHDSDAG